jgi:hypothetical protein
MNYVFTWLNKQKEGIILGAIAGVALLYYNPQFLQFLDLPSNPTWWKYSIVIYICTSIGAILDAVIKPNK